MKEYFIKNLGATLRYHDLPGDETPIVFIHGLGCISSFDYPQVAAARSLANHRRILVDLLGSGYSDKPSQFDYTINGHMRYLKKFIDDLDLRDLILYGHSMGGAIAISLAVHCIEKVSCLVVSEANLDSGGGFFSRKIAAYAEEDYVKSGHSEIVAAEKAKSNTQWAVGLENSSPLAINREATSLVEGQSPSWRELIYQFSKKKTFILGENSLPDPEIDELKKYHIQIEIVKNAGHSMAWENSCGLAKAIKNGITL